MERNMFLALRLVHKTGYWGILAGLTQPCCFDSGSSCPYNESCELFSTIL